MIKNKLMDLVNYRNKKHLRHKIKSKIELIILVSLILTQSPLNSQIRLDPEYGIKITTADLSTGMTYLTDGVIYVISNKIDIINLNGELIKSIPLDIYYGLRNMISATNGRLYIAYTKEIGGLYYGFLRMYNIDGMNKEVMISPYPTNIKAIKATPNGVYLYAQIYITFPCNVDGDNYSLCSDIEGRKIIYDLNLNEGVSLSRDVLYGDIIINEDGEVVSIKTEYDTDEQKYKTYVKDENGNRYIIDSSSRVYPMNYGIDFKGDKLLMDYYEYDMETNKLNTPQVMHLLNKTIKEVSTIRYPTINNKPANSIMRGEMKGERIYLHTLHPDFHIPNIITSQNLNGELLWYISSDERAILDFAIDELDRVYVMGIWVDILPPQYPPNASYIARYIQGGITSGWMIYKDTTTDNQIVSPQEKTKPFISVVKDVLGRGVDGVRIVWETNANWIEKGYDITSGGGISSNTVMINQVPPYEYRITAVCNECIAQMSSTTFTCCGKLPNDDFKQYDVRWRMEHYDNICSTEPAATGRYRPVYSCDDPIFNKPEYKDKKYKFTIWGKGCALTTLATLINYYKNTYNLPISSTNPKELNAFLKDSNGYSKDRKKLGGIIFSKIKEFTKSYIEYKDGYNLCLTPDKCKKIINTDYLITKLDEDILKGIPVIIRVSTPHHFMLVIGKCGGKYVVSDPEGKIELYDPNMMRKLSGIRRFRLLRQF